MTAKSIVLELVRLDPLVHDNEEGTYCFFCDGETFYRPHPSMSQDVHHESDCTWKKAAELVAEENW